VYYSRRVDDDARDPPPLWRPVLAADAFLRTYLDDRGRGWVVVRREPGRRVRIDAVQRRLLTLCDGRRTVDELAEAIGLDLGRPLSPRGVAEALEPLAAAGALAHGPARDHARPMPVEPRGLEVLEVDEARLRALELDVSRTGFDCDGRGICCGLYERLLLDDTDVANLRAAYGDDERTPSGLFLDGALHHPRDDEASGRLELAVVDGACALLEPDRRCGVHARLGIERKPDGCRSYPIRDVVCGDRLDVGLAVECRCVVDFASGPPIDALAHAQRERRVKLGMIEAVAEYVPFTLARTVARAEYVAWREAARARLGDDAAAWALGEAALLARSYGDSPQAPAGGILPQSITPAAFVPRLGPLLGELTRFFELEAANTAEVYSPRDLQRQAFEWARAAFVRLRDSLRAGTVPTERAAGERLLASEVLHAHGLLRARTLATGLFALALRIWLARAGATVALADPLLPITTVEYLHRAQAFARMLERHSALIEAALAD
jgi:lysine-N-methylase